jgi:hypothetical protein
MYNKSMNRRQKLGAGALQSNPIPPASLLCAPMKVPRSAISHPDNPLSEKRCDVPAVF